MHTMQIAMLCQVSPKEGVAILDVGATGHSNSQVFAWTPTVLAPWKPLGAIKGEPWPPVKCGL